MDNSKEPSTFFSGRRLDYEEKKGSTIFFPSQEGDRLRNFGKEQPFAGLLQM
jgi:hypothetical protein